MKKEKILCLGTVVAIFLQIIYNATKIPVVLEAIQKGTKFNVSLASNMLSLFYIIPLLIIGILFYKYSKLQLLDLEKKKNKFMVYAIFLFLIDAFLPCLITIITFFTLRYPEDHKKKKVAFENLEAEEDKESDIKSAVKGAFPIILYFVFSYLYVLGLVLVGVSADTIRNYETIFSLIQEIILLVIIVLYYRHSLINGFKNLAKHFDEYARFGIKWWMIGLFIMVTANLLIANLTPIPKAQNEVLIDTMIKQTPFFMLFSAGFYAPIVEELVFRKSLHKIIKTPGLFIFLSGTLFGLLHVLSSMTSLYDLFYIIPYGALGYCFAYMYDKTKNIALPISIHMMHNVILVTIQIIMLYL